MKKTFLFIIGLFLLLLISSFKLNYVVKNYDFNEIMLKNDKLQISDYWDEDDVEFIHIKNDNWSIGGFPWIDGGGIYAGTPEEPHIIENVTINGEGLRICIKIEDSKDYFIIRNCTLKNSGIPKPLSVIKFNNVTNGLIFNNTIKGAPIDLVDSNLNNISLNKIYDEIYIGVYDQNSSINLSGSHNNTIFYNTFTNSSGVYIGESNNNTILDNRFMNCSYGIKLTLACNNTIKLNDISGCESGVWLFEGSNGTKIIENYIYYNLFNIRYGKDCVGTIEDGNIFAPPSETPGTSTITGDGDDDDDKEKSEELVLDPFTISMIISITLIGIGALVVLIIHRKLLRRKEEQQGYSEEL